MISESSQNFQTKRRVKVVLLGDRAVGKSSIINRFITDQFQQNLQPTVGVDFMGKNVKYKGQSYRIQLWDTAGQQKYRSLVKGYLKGADACILVYDCSSINSYTNIPQWLNVFESVGSTEAFKIIVGNKCDAQFNSGNLEHTKKMIKQENGGLKQISQFTSSAKLGINIAEIFEEIMLHISIKREKNETEGLSKMIQSLGQYSKKNCCF